ncbi:MAG: protein-tyrosine phosphatase family protein, partial [Chloroflexota bacterium]|nr:protein-tyrosine phosphatase family protein [Chloroflexota bacterium]
RLAIPDMGVPRQQTMVTILDTIDQALSAGRMVYVHCWGGVGRTGTVVGCYLVRHGHTGHDALAEIARIWPTMGKAEWHPRSPETAEQARFVRDWREEPAGA